MPNVRLIPANGKAATITVNNRTYTCAAGATIDVPDFDAYQMTANNWVTLGATVGATSARPTKPSPGQTFHDTTLNITVSVVVQRRQPRRHLPPKPAVALHRPPLAR